MIRPVSPSAAKRPAAAPTSTSAPPPREKPQAREHLRARGIAALTECELMALLLGSGTPGRSAIRVARVLARRAPSELAAWPFARWMRVRGIGPARAAALTA